MAISNQTRAKARHLWEAGSSLAKTAKAVGVSVSSVTRWRDQDGWDRRPVPAEETVTEAPRFDTVDVSDVVEPVQHMDSVLIELEEAKRRLAQQEAEIDRLRPTVDVMFYDSPGQVVDVLGKDRMDEIVQLRVSDINRTRYKRGLPPINLESDDRRRYNDLVKEVADELYARRTRWAEENNLRTIKLVSPSGNIVAIPVERQFNNERGEPGASLRHYRNKGFRMPNPPLCQRGPCWNYQALDSSGSPRYGGYCSQQHHRADPYEQMSPVPGLGVAERVSI